MPGKQKKIKNTNQKSSTLSFGPKLTSSKPAVSKSGKKSMRRHAVNTTLKSKPIGSSSRFKAYKELGLKQDHTTTGRKIGGAKPAGVKKMKLSGPSASVNTTKKAKASSSGKVKRASKIRAKGEAALKSGNLKKARRLARKYNRKTK